MTPPISSRRAALRSLLVIASAMLLLAAHSAAAHPSRSVRDPEEPSFLRKRDFASGLRRHPRRASASVEVDETHETSLAKRASFTLTCKSSVDPGFDVTKVANVGMDLASNSWEYGITFDAILELCSPTRSVFSPSAFPDGKVPSISSSTHSALRYIQPLITTGGDTLIGGAGSLADPASLTIGAVMIGQSRASYLTAARKQIATLRAGPKFFNGAISSRADVAELWADAMYMFPPALAYYAPTTQNVNQLKSAVDQATYYRQVLQANTTASWEGLWVHIVGPQSATAGVWLTGNGWAAMGLVRILATMDNWSRTKDWTERPALIRKYIYEILSGCKAVGTSPDGTGLLANYLVGDSSGQNAPAAGNFGDATGTAMIVSVVYRMAVLDPSAAKPYLAWADKLRGAVAKTVKSSGYVRQTVNPYDWFNNEPYTKGSAEGQAATVLMAAAYRSCVKAKRCSS